MSPLRVIIAVAALLVLLFLGPVAYYTGKHIGLYFACPEAKGCWEEAGVVIYEGAKGPK